MEIEKVLGTNFKDNRQKAIINLRVTSNHIGHIYNNYMAKFDLSMAQFNILRILRGAKATISVNTVKDRMVERSPNTTRLMDKLIEKNLIERIRCDEDRRVVYVTISESGLELLAKIDEDFKFDFHFANNISDEEAILLSQLLDKLRGD